MITLCVGLHIQENSQMIYFIYSVPHTWPLYAIENNMCINPPIKIDPNKSTDIFLKYLHL